MATPTKQLLTYSRRSCMAACPRRHYLRYEVGLSRDGTNQPLRMGTMYHAALDTLHRYGFETAVSFIGFNYSSAHRPSWSDEQEWAIEGVVVESLFRAWCERYRDDGIEVIASELSYQTPLVNPDTGRSSPLWDSAGVIDRIVRLPDGTFAVQEFKTTSDDIGITADYWVRLQLDNQISGYVVAARSLGYDIQTVVYDVCRKPLIEPLSVALLDEDGLKIVLDFAGMRQLLHNGQPRQSGDSAKGWKLQTRKQTPDEFRERLDADIRERPDWYFRRQPIPRLDTDLEQYRVELWIDQQHMRECQRLGHWCRNTDSCLKPYRCQFFEVCRTFTDPKTDGIPNGFVILDNVHPELERSQNVNGPVTDSAPIELPTTAPCAAEAGEPAKPGIVPD